MLPLFKSHFSIGKSILTLDESSQEGGPDSILEIATSNKLDKLILVEDSLIGFLHAEKSCRNLNIDLIFGLRLDYFGVEGDESSKSKIIVFAKNGEGCVKLNKIFTTAHTSSDKGVTTKQLKEIWEDKELKLAVPFYDSFLYNNYMKFSNCIIDLSFTTPTFFTESNGLPFDSAVEEKVLEYCADHKIETELVKSIYYKQKSDIEAFQTYKCICSRKFGRKTLSKPNLDHFGSNEFSFESWKESVA
jgi:DNA polymerase III alpha subunit